MSSITKKIRIDTQKSVRYEFTENMIMRALIYYLENSRDVVLGNIVSTEIDLSGGYLQSFTIIDNDKTNEEFEGVV